MAETHHSPTNSEIQPEQLTHFRERMDKAISHTQYEDRKRELSELDQDVSAYLVQYTKSFEMNLFIAELSWHMERPDEAIEELRHILSVAPKDYRGYALLGRYLLYAGLTDQALNFLDRAIELSPGQDDVRRLRERGLRRKKKAYARIDGQHIEGSTQHTRIAQVTTHLDSGNLKQALNALQDNNNIRQHLQAIFNSERSQKKRSSSTTSQSSWLKKYATPIRIVSIFVLATVAALFFQWRMSDTGRSFSFEKHDDMGLSLIERLLADEPASQFATDILRVHAYARHALYAPDVNDVTWFDEAGSEINLAETAASKVAFLRQLEQQQPPLIAQLNRANVNPHLQNLVQLSSGLTAYQQGAYHQALRSWGALHQSVFQPFFIQSLMLHAYISTAQPAQKEAWFEELIGQRTIDAIALSVLTRLAIASRQSKANALPEAIQNKLLKGDVSDYAIHHFGMLALIDATYANAFKNKIKDRADFLKQHAPHLFARTMIALLHLGAIDLYDQLDNGDVPDDMMVEVHAYRAALKAGDDFGRTTPIKNQRFNFIENQRSLHRPIHVESADTTYPIWMFEQSYQGTERQKHRRLLPMKVRLAVAFERLSSATKPSIKKALEAYPEKSDAIYALVLAKVALIEKNTNVAKEMLQRVIALKPVAPEFLLKTAPLLLQMEEKDLLATWLSAHEAAGHHFPTIRSQIQ